MDRTSARHAIADYYCFRVCVKSKDKCISFNKINWFGVCLNQITITPRLLLSHLSGIRHYEKDSKKVRDEKAKRLQKPPEKKEDEKSSDETEEKCTQQNNRIKSKDAKHSKKKKEFEKEEYYLKDGFDSVIQALDLFKDDPLIFEPGEHSLQNEVFVTSSDSVSVDNS